jgi:DME family drug/metabolite transporter
MSGLRNLLLAGLLFGAGGPVGGLLARATGLAPLAVAAYRLTVGGALIVMYLMSTRGRLPRGRSAWCRISIMGGLAALCQGCYFAAAGLSSVTLATLITIGTAPVLVLAVDRASGRTRRLTWAILLALPGLGLLVGSPAGRFELAGAALAVVAAGGFAAITLVGARPVSGVDGLPLVGFGFGLGGLLLAGVAGADLRFHVDVRSAGLVLLLGAVPTGLAYGLYFRALRQVGAATGAVLALLEPLSGALLAAVLLGDRLSPSGMAGAIMLGGAMIMASSPPQRVTRRLRRHDVGNPDPVKSNPHR